MEGGANVLSESLAAGLPVVSSNIPGLVGTLGGDYPGLFPPGDTAALAKLLNRAEADRAFYALLVERCNNLRPLVDPAAERAAWESLLAEFR